MLQDFRLALRQLWAAKGFTATAVLTLALGIGANTGIFTLVHSIMLKSLPVADPATIVRVGDGDNCCVLGGTQGRFSVYSYGLYTYLRDHTPELEDMAAFQAGSSQVGVRRTGAAESSPFVDQFVSGNYFRLWGLKAFAGRLIEPADDVRGAAPVAVMSYRAWQQHYNGDPAVIGASFYIEGSPYQIVGVAPPGFFGAALRPDPPDFWMPLATEPAVHGKNALLDNATNHWLYVFARQKAGTRAGQVERQVEAKMTTELRQWLMENEKPATDKARQGVENQHISIVAGGGGLSAMKENYRRDLTLLMSITGLVLLIACANLANLQLARGAAATGQTSIRVALGAPRSRLVQQVLVESTVLAVAGGVVGLVVATETAGLLIAMAFHGAKHVPIETSPEPLVLGFAFLLSVATGVVFGIAPAWSASRANPAAALHGAGRSASGRSTLPQKTLVVLQAALSLVLLCGAGLMTQTMRNLTNQQFGFQMDGSVVVNVNPGFGGYAPERLASVYAEIERQMRQIPGVRNVGLALYTPMSGNNWQMGASLEAHPQTAASPSWDRVSAGFFDTMGARILRGRGFTERDTPEATHVAVVNQMFADTYFPNEDPLGKRFGLGGPSHRADYTIVGVVNTIRFRNPRGPGRPMFFVPLLQMSAKEWENNTLARSNLINSIVLRVSGNPPDLGPRIQRALGSVDPNLTVLNVVPTSEMLGALLGHEQTIGGLSQIFGVLALALASIGLYGLTAYSVARRTAEIGVRTALGATRGQVVRLILGGAVAQAGVGLAVGIPAALGAGRLLADQLYGVKTYDPWVFATAAGVLAVCAAIAGVIPAVRASSIDPVVALRGN